MVSRVLVTSLMLGWMQATSTSAFVVPAPAAAGSFCGECGNKQVRGDPFAEALALSANTLLSMCPSCRRYLGVERPHSTFNLQKVQF